MVADEKKRSNIGGRLRRCANFGRDKCADCDESDMDAETCDVIAQRQCRQNGKKPKNGKTD